LPWTRAKGGCQRPVIQAARIAGGRRAEAGGRTRETKLAGNAQKKAPGATPAAPQAANILSLTIAANRIAGNGPGVNSYELRNEILNRERIRYESDGKTVNGYTADQLFENAKGAGNHRRTLARNINKGSGVARPAAVCAHHIVASQDIDASLSREHIFACSIGINDADNGVYSRRPDGLLRKCAMSSRPACSPAWGMDMRRQPTSPDAAPVRPKRLTRGATRWANSLHCLKTFRNRSETPRSAQRFPDSAKPIKPLRPSIHAGDGAIDVGYGPRQGRAVMFRNRPSNWISPTKPPNQLRSQRVRATHPYRPAVLRVETEA
jgi:hypothetical protein